MNAKISLLAAIALYLLNTLFVSAEQVVQIEFFFSVGCSDCRSVRDEVLPVVFETFGEQVQLAELDISSISNYARLAEYQDKLMPEGNDPVCVVLNGKIFLGGQKNIRERLFSEVERLLLEEPSEIAAVEGSSDQASLETRFQSWNVWKIAGFGLADGLNPCAFATLIFFMTMLIAARQTRDKLLAVGIGFCLAVFLTYLALGFGAFHALRKLSAYELFSDWLRRVMAALLLLLAVLSFRDAWMYRRNGRTQDVTLQLPPRIKAWIHGIMRRTLRASNLFFAAFAVGFAVTLLESVCTGQMYLPALVYMSSHPTLRHQAWGLLLLYNFMFVLPQVIVFAAAYKGASSKRLLEVSRAHVGPAKLLLGLLFLLLAVLLWRLRAVA